MQLSRIQTHHTTLLCCFAATHVYASVTRHPVQKTQQFQPGGNLPPCGCHVCIPGCSPPRSLWGRRHAPLCFQSAICSMRAVKGMRSITLVRAESETGVSGGALESFCVHMHPDSRGGCEHMLSTGHVAGPEIAQDAFEDGRQEMQHTNLWGCEEQAGPPPLFFVAGRDHIYDAGWTKLHVSALMYPEPLLRTGARPIQNITHPPGVWRHLTINPPVDEASAVVELPSRTRCSSRCNVMRMGLEM